MGATSVTGTGQGAAYAGIKGPGNERNFFVPEINPHIVAAGEVDLDGGTKQTYFPNVLSGSESGYVVVVESQTANRAYVSAKADDTDNNFESFTVTGTGTDTVSWMVLKAGLGLHVTA